MSVVDVCLELETLLKQSDESNWGLLQVPRDLIPEVVLDPDVLYQCRERKLFIMPIQHLPRMTDSPGRMKKVSLTMHRLFAIGLLIPFDTFKHNDLGQLGDIRAAFDLWEKLDKFVLKYLPYQVIDVVPEPPVEIEMSQKNFLVITEYTIEGSECL